MHAASGRSKPGLMRRLRESGLRRIVASRRLDYQHIRDATLIHAVLSEVLNVPEEVCRRLDGVHGGLNRRVAVQRDRNAVVGEANVVLR